MFAVRRSINLQRQLVSISIGCRQILSDFLDRSIAMGNLGAGYALVTYIVYTVYLQAWISQRLNSTLVVCEHNNDQLQSSTLNTVTAASKIGGDITCLVAGNQCAKVLLCPCYPARPLIRNSHFMIPIGFYFRLLKM